MEMREPKSVMAGIWWRGWWDVIRDRGDERELEVQVKKDVVVDSGEVVSCTKHVWYSEHGTYY